VARMSIAGSNFNSGTAMLWSTSKGNGTAVQAWFFIGVIGWAHYLGYIAD